MNKRAPVVAIVGRTNVGKSTLFNALVRRRIAVVEDTPGVTRDRNYALVKDETIPYTLVDTGGLVGEDQDEQIPGMASLVRAQAEIAIEESDVILVVFDGIGGPAPLDDEVVDFIRRAGKPVVWVVNKCERPLNEVLAAEFYALGISELVCVSAAHRLGIEGLRTAIMSQFEELGITAPPVPEEGTPQSETDLSATKEIRVAIVGKPNVGKSSLVNRLCGEERVIAADAPGTTRDCIDVSFVRDGRKFTFVDTAGLRKKSRVAAMTLERFSNLRTLKALVGADVAILMLDASEGAPSEQDKKIAELVHERGRGLIIVANKWDLVEKDHRTAKAFEEAIYRELPFARYAPIIFVSALTGRRCPNILDRVREVYESSQIRIPTGELNRMLQRIFQLNPPPVIRGHPVKLFFATQIAVAPPTILMFLNYPKELQPSYLRYVKQQIRKIHPMEGVDFKLQLRKRTEKEQTKRESKGVDTPHPVEAPPEEEWSGEDHSYSEVSDREIGVSEGLVDEQA